MEEVDGIVHERRAWFMKGLCGSWKGCMVQGRGAWFMERGAVVAQHGERYIQDTVDTSEGA